MFRRALAIVLILVLVGLTWFLTVRSQRLAGDEAQESGRDGGSAQAKRFSAQVQRKGRSVTLELPKTAAAGGTLQPYDHVDVVASLRDPDSGKPMVLTVLQNIIVLLAEPSEEPNPSGVRTAHPRELTRVSLLLPPKEAELLVLAADLGTLTLSLRNEDDTDVLESNDPTTFQSLLAARRLPKGFDCNMRGRSEIVPPSKPGLGKP